MPRIKFVAIVDVVKGVSIPQTVKELIDYVSKVECHTTKISSIKVKIEDEDQPI